MQDGDFSRTAMGIRALAVYGIPARKGEIAERIARAADWLARQTPQSTEERVMQILGLNAVNQSCGENSKWGIFGSPSATLQETGRGFALGDARKLLNIGMVRQTQGLPSRNGSCSVAQPSQL
jgi:hypothetical protein